MANERQLYRSARAYWANQLLFPLKMVVPQPLIRKVPGLTSNEDIRTGLVLAEVRGRLLDIGCGHNRLVRRYRERGGQGTGVDVFPWPGCDLVVEDTAALDFEDGSFDTVTMVACINHIPNRDEVLHEAARLLAPGGRLVLTNLPPGLSRLWHAWAFWDHDKRERGMREGEVYGIDAAELRALLTGAGYRLIEMSRFSWGINQLWICEPERAGVSSKPGGGDQPALDL